MDSMLLCTGHYFGISTHTYQVTCLTISAHSHIVFHLDKGIMEELGAI